MLTSFILVVFISYLYFRYLDGSLSVLKFFHKSSGLLCPGVLVYSISSSLIVQSAIRERFKSGNALHLLLGFTLILTEDS